MLNSLALLLASDAGSGSGSGAGATGGLMSSPWVSLIMLGLLFVLMYFMMIRPQRKKQKEEQKMRNSLRVGDEIVTIGGICGRVLSIKEDALVIETGADRSKMTVKKWALQECLTVHDTNDDLDDDFDDDDDDLELEEAKPEEKKPAKSKKKK